MGCMYSKAIARSMSIREELNHHGFQSSSLSWEDLMSSHSGNDPLFAFVCSANAKTTTKLRTSDFTLPSTGPDTGPYLANARDLVAEINARTEVQSGSDPVSKHDPNSYTRSKSCEIIREIGKDENKLDWRDKNVTGSRSFHTVEEYDALLERIRKFSSRSVQHFEDYYHYSSEDVNLPKTNDFDENRKNFEKVVRVDGSSETGWKRKALAKDLTPLEVSTIEFPDNTRLRQQGRFEGQIFSPGTYVTPKFGSYNEKLASKTKGKEGGENSVFSRELVAAFEDCMHQLEVEEESILRQMDEHLPAKGEMENQVEVT